MVWGVLGSTTSLPSEALRGNFVGAAADASLEIGAGAKVLVGGNKKSIVLQPSCVQGQTGVNLAVGVSGLKLEERWSITARSSFILVVDVHGNEHVSAWCGLTSSSRCRPGLGGHPV